MIPSFFCVGTQKAGTTTLYELLKQHPDIYLPDCKETHFFDIDKKYKKGIEWYESNYFSKIKSEKIAGEITPIYMYLDFIPERIYKCLGTTIKLLFILRDPINRAYSHYWMSYGRGYEKKGFKDATILEKQRIEKGSFEKSHFSYIDRGFYFKQINRYLRYFKKRNMKFILFEDFIANLELNLYEIFNFLGVNSSVPINYNIKANPTKTDIFEFLGKLIRNPPTIIRNLNEKITPSIDLGQRIKKFLLNINQKEFKKPSIEENLRDRLLHLYRPDIIKLEELIDKDLSLWMRNK